MIPLVDLAWQNEPLAELFARHLRSTIATSQYILGPGVSEFEARYAQFLGAGHCVGVANGTDAVELALRATGVGTGDEVVVPANTFVATALAVERVGAKPILVDCDARYHLVDPELIPSLISPKTRAIIAVHLYGQMAPMAPLRQLCSEHGLTLLEDAAQAQGATQDLMGERLHAGTVGEAAGTSFYPGKNLGALGDAGAVLCRSDDTARKIRALRNYGSEVRYHHPELGFNSRLDEFQARVLSEKLAYLGEWNAWRARVAAQYTRLLSDIPDLELPSVAPNNHHVWHLYVVTLPADCDRDACMRHMHAEGVGVSVHYPVPVHLQGAFRHLGYGSGDFPVAEQKAARMLSLPIFPGMSEAQVESVSGILKLWLANAR